MKKLFLALALVSSTASANEHLFAVIEESAHIVKNGTILATARTQENGNGVAMTVLHNNSIYLCKHQQMRGTGPGMFPGFATLVCLPLYLPATADNP